MLDDGTPGGTEDRQRLSFRLRAFVLLRLTLIIASSYLVLAQYGFHAVPTILSLLVFLGLVSNLAFWWIPRRTRSSPRLFAGLVLFDTLWIAALLVFTGRFDSEFFYLFFFVVLLSAIGENLAVILLGTLAACTAYFLVVYLTMGRASLLTTATLVRVPFLISVAGFYGYLVDRIRKERQAAAAERLVIEQLRVQQRQLEEVNRRLASEIEDRKRIEEELQRASEMKSVFVSTVSHEVKTPLTSIKNAVDLLTPAVLDLGETERRFLEIAKRNIERLNLIIGDLLEISRIEAGKIRCRFSEVAPREFLAPVVAALTPEASRKSLDVSLDVDDELPAVWADPNRMEQVVTNLLGNAVKFTAEGGRIVVSARRMGEDVEISVADSGVGLSAEDRERVFEPFYQAGDPLTDKARGTGLGLAISWNLVAAHGSELRVESEPGKGSRFYFRLARASERALEKTALEEAVRQFAAFPFFSLLVVGAEWERAAGAVERAAEVLSRALPRSSDKVIAQPAHGRILIVLLGTALDGGRIVRARVLEALRSEIGAVVRVHGPAVYPENGTTGFQLIGAAMAAGDEREED